MYFILYIWYISLVYYFRILKNVVKLRNATLPQIQSGKIKVIYAIWFDCVIIMSKDAETKSSKYC